MNSKPVSYETLKSVFKHMDVNKRIEFSFNCPAVQTAEKAAPLYIDSMAYQLRGIKLNDKVYEIPTTPEDLKFQEKWDLRDEHLSDEIEMQDKTVREYEIALDYKKIGRPHRLDCGSIEEIQLGLERERVCLSAYEAQQNRIDKAMLQLGVYLFGGRRSIIQVNCFGDGPSWIKLPKDIMFHIRQITPDWSIQGSWSILGSIIYNSKFTFECIRFIDMRTFQMSDWEFQYAKKIIIDCEVLGFIHFLPIVIHPNVHVVRGNFLSPDGLKTLIDNWIEKSRPIGTQWTFDDNEHDKKSKMEMINTALNVEMSDICPAVILMPNLTKLEISMWKNENQNERTWTMMLKVEAGTEQ